MFDTIQRANISLLSRILWTTWSCVFSNIISKSLCGCTQMFGSCRNRWILFCMKFCWCEWLSSRCRHYLAPVNVLLSPNHLQVPSCLILQMPRFGKKFKMFEKIVPSLELDITDLLSEGTNRCRNLTGSVCWWIRVCVVSGPQQCMLCGKLAQEECTDCFKDPLFCQTGFKMFCETCSAQVCLTAACFKDVISPSFCHIYTGASTFWIKNEETNNQIIRDDLKQQTQQMFCSHDPDP